MKGGRREKDPFSWPELLAPSDVSVAPVTPGFVVDDATEAAMHGERGRISHATACVILARHHQTSRHSQVPKHIDVLHQFTNRSGPDGSEWQTVPLTLGALRDWLGY